MDLTQELAEHSFTRHLDSQFREWLLQATDAVHFDKNQYIFRTGEPARYFYLLTGGEVVLELPVSAPQSASTNPPENSVNPPKAATPTPHNIETLGADDVLGWSWLFPPYRWRFDARATKPTRALAIDGEWLRNLCMVEPELGYELLKEVALVLVERLQATRLRLLECYAGAGTETPGEDDKG